MTWMESTFDSKKLLAMKPLCSEIHTTNSTGMPNFLHYQGPCNPLPSSVPSFCPHLWKKIVRILTLKISPTIINGTVSRKGKGHLHFHPLLKAHPVLPYWSISQVTTAQRSTSNRNSVKFGTTHVSWGMGVVKPWKIIF